MPTQGEQTPLDEVDEGGAASVEPPAVDEVEAAPEGESPDGALEAEPDGVDRYAQGARRLLVVAGGANDQAPARVAERP